MVDSGVRFEKFEARNFQNELAVSTFKRKTIRKFADHPPLEFAQFDKTLPSFCTRIQGPLGPNPKRLISIPNALLRAERLLSRLKVYQQYVKTEASSHSFWQFNSRIRQYRWYRRSKQHSQLCSSSWPLFAWWLGLNYLVAAQNHAYTWWQQLRGLNKCVQGY